MATGVKTSALPAVKRRVHSGVPVYVVDGPAPARCALMFRVGRADETLRNGGVTHLVEHLALFPLGDQPYQYNGFVDAHRTVFHVTGRPEECTEFIAAVSAGLAELPLHRLEHEHRVLSAEAAGHGAGLFDSLVVYRFGPRGLGRVGYPQLGASSLTGPAVDAWRARWFTAANAALVVSGVPVEDLRLSLPSGERRTPVAPSSIEDDLPAWFSHQGDALGVSMVAPRGPALSAALRILEKRVLRRLRTEMAVVYRAGISMQYLDAEAMHAVLACDPLPDHAADALDAIREEVARLADDGPTAAELEADRVAVHRQYDDPLGAYALADILAQEELLGAERRTPASMGKALRSVTGEDAACALATAWRTALWGLPRGLDSPQGMRMVSMSSKERIDGRRLAPTTLATTRGQAPDARLVVADRGVGIDAGEWHVHVDYERCAGALAWKDGARVLYGDDGFVLRLLPWEWDGGTGVVSEVDARLDPGLVIDMGEGSGPPPAPAPPVARRGGGTLTKRGRQVVTALGLCLLALLALVMPFTSPTLRPAEIDGVEAAAVPVDSSGYVRCGGSALTVVRQGASVPDIGAVTSTVARACEDDARLSVAIASVSGVLFAGGVGWVGWNASRRRRRDQPAVS